ncbi:hypothetical protein ABK905_16085 [Acerihabitans sp. KWT182]|uniref:Uncharacterized protein n=1 Tax=Acerihabitans sp. KWT182 TaxID=3157919 RepID=A0AAU7Q5G0_9GAMM
MKKNPFLNELKENYVELSRTISAKSDVDLAIDTKLDLDHNFEQQIARLRDAVVFLKRARDAGDGIAAQAAILHISSYAMRLSNFFSDIDVDAGMLLKTLQWPAIPENYKIPEHYHFPHK